MTNAIIKTNPTKMFKSAVLATMTATATASWNGAPAYGAAPYGARDVSVSVEQETPYGKREYSISDKKAGVVGYGAGVGAYGAGYGGYGAGRGLGYGRDVSVSVSQEGPYGVSRSYSVSDKKAGVVGYGAGYGGYGNGYGNRGGNYGYSN